MFRPIELYIGLRYTRAKRRNHFISFISFISMAGIALGITALITVISVMNGFEKELRERILSMTSHAALIGMNPGLADSADLADLALEHPDVIGAAPYVRAEAMLTRSGLVSGAIVRGIDPDREARVSSVLDHLLAGSFDALEAGGFGVILGSELARYLGATVGDKITMVTPQATTTPAGIMPRIRRFTVVGIFEIGMYEYDRNLALIDIYDAQKLFRLGDRVTGVRLKLDDMFAAPRIVREVARDAPQGVLVSDWTREHANFFRAVQIEKTAMFVILALIIAVAAFNIVSTLVMVVTDKQADIAVLRTLGATPLSILAIFVIQGTTIGLVGTGLGILGGVGLALNVETVVGMIESLAGIKFLAPDVYYISDLPSDLHWNDVLLTATVALILTVLATLYPAWRAARTRPAEALSYE